MFYFNPNTALRQCRTGRTGFSLSAFDFCHTIAKTNKLKHVLLESATHQREHRQEARAAQSTPTVIALTISTHRAGRLSWGATSLNGPSPGPSGTPSIVSASRTSESWKLESSSASE
jgi:hypothetical protein